MMADDNLSTTNLEQRYQLHTDGNPAEVASCNSNDTPIPALGYSFENKVSGLDDSSFTGAGVTYSSRSITSRLTSWFYKSAWPGLGLFGESYLLFSIGTLKPIWQELFPECFNLETCTPRLLDSLAYSVVLGVICGMILVGYLANDLGRRKGSLLTASLMSSGAIGLVLVSAFMSNSPTWMYRCMSIFMFWFGLGVGGEYPLSASSASERAVQHRLKQSQLRAMDELERLQRAENDAATLRRQNSAQYPLEIPGHPFAKSAESDISTASTNCDRRGRQIQLVFTMQGLGIWFNSIVLMFLLMITDQTGQNDYNHESLLTVWRITYLIGASILLFVLVTRFIYLGESKVWADDKNRRDQQQNARSATPSSSSFERERPTGRTKAMEENMPPAIETNCSTVSSLSYPTLAFQEYDDQILQPVPSTEPEEDLQATPTSLLVRNFGVRLFGASMSWLLWDISFYGNKLFQSTFLLALTGENTTLLEFMAAAALNATVSLLGYFAAAELVDNPNVGRVRLQAGGFLVTGALFIMCGFTFEQLSSKGLVAMYLASGFFGQLGPNATTFLIPAEIFPTEMRTLCHGICAASGKLGALIAAIMFNFMKREVDLFLLSGYASFLACLVTVWTIPETSGLDILEIDRKWRMTLDGRKRDYTGAANHPDNLSMYERWKLGLHY